MAATALDRLRLTDGRIEAMAAGLRTVAGLADPVGEVVDGWIRPNGLRVERVRVPLGVVGVIYENRPNVTSDAAGLCLKAGNAAFLRGSASALGLQPGGRGGAAAGAGQGRAARGRRGPGGGHEPRDRGGLHAPAGLIDCLIPRGGPALIASLLEHATVPYVLDGDGNCHVYVDAAADLAMARGDRGERQDPASGRVQRRRDAAGPRGGGRRRSCPRLARRHAGRRRAASATTGCGRCCPRSAPATEDDFATEFLGLTAGRGRGRRPRRGDRAHRPVRLGPLRGDRDRRPAGGRPLRRRGRRGRRGGQRLHPVHRRRGARPRGRGRASRPRSCTPAGRWACASSTCVKWVVRGDGQVRR